MFYVEKETGQILDFYSVRLKFPRVSFTQYGPDEDFLNENGLAVLDTDVQPSFANGQSLQPTDTAELIDGKWVRIINVVGEPIPEEPVEPEPPADPET